MKLFYFIHYTPLINYYIISNTSLIIQEDTVFALNLIAFLHLGIICSLHMGYRAMLQIRWPSYISNSAPDDNLLKSRCMYGKSPHELLKVTI
jgi:hypothetical protein